MEPVLTCNHRVELVPHTGREWVTLPREKESLKHPFSDFVIFGADKIG